MTGDAARFATLTALRPLLHRYCARLMGSVIDGEDIVQDSFLRATAALPDLPPEAALQPWLFRIAHNRALDVLRARALRMTEPITAVADRADPEAVDAEEGLLRREAVATAISRFAELAVPQRSAVILKDVLGHSLQEIAALLDLTVDGVKGHLARGRARLRVINARPVVDDAPWVPSAAVTRYVTLFNRRDWDGLRALLADDVRLRQSAYPERVGSADVAMFFGEYARKEPLHLVPARLEGREVIAVFADPAAALPSYVMWLDWRDGRICFIRDYRYVRYVTAEADLVLGPART